jgi:hypothetical protein
MTASRFIAKEMIRKKNQKRSISESIHLKIR